MDKNVKDFFDTLKDTANVVGETVAEVTRESAKKLGVKKESAKLNMEVLRVRAGIEGLYNEIGKENYALHICEDEAEAEECQAKIDGLLEEIDAKQEQIVQLNRQIDLLNGGVACGECGRVSPSDYEFCPACGARLEKPCCAEEECADGECCSCGCEDEKPEESACACGCDACGEEAASCESGCACDPDGCACDASEEADQK